MGIPYTIRIFVPDGDPEGPKVVELLNWTGKGIAFPRDSWPKMSQREEMTYSGVYILIGSGEGVSDELPTVYVGQGEEIKTRIDAHSNNKDFWDWGYAFVSTGNALNRAHITWIEHSLIKRAKEANRCHLDNGTTPREPSLSESEKADTAGFLREILRILPILGVRVFEKPKIVEVQAQQPSSMPSNEKSIDSELRDTILVPAKPDNFETGFMQEMSWGGIRIGGGMLPKIRYIAAYQSSPVSAVTHYAPVKTIEPSGDGGKYKLNFSEPAKELPQPIPFADANPGAMQGPRYTSFEKLLSAKKISDLF